MRFVVKKVLPGIVIAMLVSAVAVTALAKGHDKVKKESVTFPSDTSVNGTLLKAGDYDIRFNEETNDLSILKNGKVVAEAKAQLQDRANKAPGTQLETKDNVLIALAFRGQTQDIVIAPGAMTTGQ